MLAEKEIPFRLLPDQNKKPMQIRLDPVMRQRLERAAFESNIQMTTIMRMGIEKQLKEMGF